jgi:Lambda phage tail tube protein, TTP
MEYAGYRTLLKRLTTPPSTYTMVAQVEDLDGPQLESKQIEVSHRADGVPSNMWRRYVSGMKDGGQVKFSVVFDPDDPTHDPTLTDSLYAIGAAGTPSDFMIDFPGAGTDRTTAKFSAYVTNFDATSKLEDGLKADLVLKISGQVTWAHVP